MSNIIIPLEDKDVDRLKHFSTVNWSSDMKEELIKRDIFERYIKTGEVTDEDWEYCEEIDWHPVDELPLREESVKRLEEAKKQKPIEYKSLSELFKRIR